MAWTDNANRLWLLSMMTMGCVGGGDEPADTQSTDAATGTTSSGPGDGTTSVPPTSGTTAADDTTTDAATTDLTTTDGETTEGTSGSGSDEDSTGSSGGSSGDSSGESTTGVGPLTPFVEACAAAYSTYFDCYRRIYSEEEVLALCAQYEGYLEDYGEGCLESQIEYYACISDLDCQDLENLGPGSPNCNDEYLAGNAACPDLFSYCSTGGGGGGPDGCGIEATMCLDGNSYAVDCDAMTCTCSINGVPGETFDSPGVESCFDDGFADTAETACGFPGGIFF